MKTALAYIWQRRWCRLLLVGIALCALPLLHPFVRQSIFGPTIDGIPWCVWENEYRNRGNPGNDPWVYKWLKKFGIINEESIGHPPHNADALPFYVHKVKSGDAPVRREALHDLKRYLPEEIEAVLPVFRQSLQDEDPGCRLVAAGAVWEATQDVAMKSVALPLLKHPDWRIRQDAAIVLDGMASKSSELFEPLSEATEDATLYVRITAVRSMWHFGKRGVPIVQKALRDPDSQMRMMALIATAELGKDAEPLIPIVVSMQNEPALREPVFRVLYRLDPKRFPKPASWVD